MTNFEGKVLQELSVLKAQMQQLMGIGQPGRLHQLEARVESHERSVQRLKGIAAALGALWTVVHIAIAYFTEKRN
ncbi:MAG TPA: hypothetical protein VIJ38_08590 [Acidobacteriaceae bacterium]|jgi:hypothetical protein